MRMEKHLTKLEGLINGTPIYKYEDTKAALSYDLHLPNGTKFFVSYNLKQWAPCIANVIVGDGQCLRCLRLNEIKNMYVAYGDDEFRSIGKVFDIVQSTECLSDLYCIPKK